MSDKIVCNIYNYGSYVYGTNNIHSDRDYAVVLGDNYTQDDFMIYTKNRYKDEIVRDFHFYTYSEFTQLVKDMDFKAIECLLLPDRYKEEDFPIEFILDENKLRCSASKLSSNSWVKAKKKLIVEKDYNTSVGIKSFFHSFRILSYAIEIAQTNQINNWSAYNYILFDLIEKSAILTGVELWNYMFTTYRETYRELQLNFKNKVKK